MSSFDEKKLKQERDEPQKIIDIANQIEDSKGKGTVRVVSKFGDGKTQGGLCVNEDWFATYQHETAWDKYTDMLELIESDIRPDTEAYFICGWNKALGIKDHDGTMASVEWLPKEKVPDRFTAMWGTSMVQKLRRETVKQGGKQTRIENRKTTFFGKWKEQLDADTLEGKVIFSTVDMALANKWLAEELDIERIFVDEGVAGQVNDKEINDVEELLRGFTYSNKGKSSTNYSPRRVDTHKKTDVQIKQEWIQDLIDSLCWIQRQAEQGRGDQMKVEAYNNDIYINGKLEIDDPDEVKINDLASEMIGSEWQKELQKNNAYRSELLALQSAVKWVKKFLTHGAVYQVHDSDLTKMGLMQHQLERLREFTDDLVLLRATWSPAWDEAKGTDPELVDEQHSIRETDYNNYSANIIQVKYSDEKASIEKEQMKTGKAEYLWKLLEKTDWLCIGPKNPLDKFFRNDFDYYTRIVGKNHGSYDKQVSVGLPRLPPQDMVYEAIKEFKQLPENPNNEDVRFVVHGSLHGFSNKDDDGNLKSPLLQAIWEDRVEAKVVDSLFRTARSPDQSGTIYFIGCLTEGIKQDWFGNLDLYATTTFDDFADKVVKANRIFQESIELGKKYPVNMREKEWTQGKADKMKINYQWAIQYLDWKDSVETTELREFTGGNYQACRKALTQADRKGVVKKVGNGIWDYT